MNISFVLAATIISIGLLYAIIQFYRNKWGNIELSPSTRTRIGIAIFIWTLIVLGLIVSAFIN